MHKKLKRAAKAGSINVLYDLLKEDPHLLEEIDKVPITNTPLHVAAESGKTHFALEVANLRPTLASKLNPDGLSPLHLALRNRRLETARGLIAIDGNLVRVKGKAGITPLHEVVLMDNAFLLEEFLRACPSSIEDLTTRRETAFHIAIKNLKLSCFLFLFGWLHRVDKEEILNWKDEDGNTVLHIGVAKNLPQVVELLINSVDADLKNGEDLNALELFKHSVPKNDKMGTVLKSASLLSRALNSLVRNRNRYLLGEIRTPPAEPINSSTTDIHNLVMVVAVLIATATYQAVLSPPGGYWSEGNLEGKSTMSTTDATYFVLLNTSAFCASVCTIVILMMGLPFGFLLEASTMFVSCSYYVSLLNIFTPLDPPMAALLLMSGAVLIGVHLVAFEVHRRQRNRRRVGICLWDLPEQDRSLLDASRNWLVCLLSRLWKLISRQ